MNNHKKHPTTCSGETLQDLLCRTGDKTYTRDDKCYITKDELQSVKPLKYITTNFFDKDIILNRGINFTDGYGIPSCYVDKSTASRIGTMTNNNMSMTLPGLPLPTTASYAKGQGCVSDEQKLRAKDERPRKQQQPMDSEYHDRSFYIFSNAPIVPNSCWKRHVQHSNAYRGGVSTRNSMNTQYRHCKK